MKVKYYSLARCLQSQNLYFLMAMRLLDVHYGKSIILEVAKTLGTKWVNETMLTFTIDPSSQVSSIPEIKSLQLSDFPETSKNLLVPDSSQGMYLYQRV